MNDNSNFLAYQGRNSCNIQLTNKVNVTSPLKKLTFGCLQEYNFESIDLRKQQILNDFRLHSCYHYSKSLEVIQKASEETQLIPKMITKVYFNFRINNSFFTILDQLYRITDRLKTNK